MYDKLTTSPIAGMIPPLYSTVCTAIQQDWPELEILESEMC